MLKWVGLRLMLNWLRCVLNVGVDVDGWGEFDLDVGVNVDGCYLNFNIHTNL